MKRLGLVMAWVAATVIAVVLATQAVQLVAGSVTAGPTPVALTSLTTATTSDISPTVAVTSTSTSTPATSPSSVPATTSTTSTPSTTPTTSVTSTTVTTSTTSPPSTVPGESGVYGLVGGSVTVQCTGDEIRLLAASANVGFQAEIEDEGPEEIEVEFNSSSHESKFEAQCESGVLDVDTEEEPKG